MERKQVDQEYGQNAIQRYHDELFLCLRARNYVCKRLYWHHASKNCFGKNVEVFRKTLTIILSF